MALKLSALKIPDIIIKVGELELSVSSLKTKHVDNFIKLFTSDNDCLSNVELVKKYIKIVSNKTNNGEISGVEDKDLNCLSDADVEFFSENYVKNFYKENAEDKDRNPKNNYTSILCAKLNEEYRKVEGLFDSITQTLKPFTHLSKDLEKSLTSNLIFSDALKEAAKNFQSTLSDMGLISKIQASDILGKSVLETEMHKIDKKALEGLETKAGAQNEFPSFEPIRFDPKLLQIKNPIENTNKLLESLLVLNSQTANLTQSLNDVLVKINTQICESVERNERNNSSVQKFNKATIILSFLTLIASVCFSLYNTNQTSKNKEDFLLSQEYFNKAIENNNNHLNSLNTDVVLNLSEINMNTEKNNYILNNKSSVFYDEIIFESTKSQ